LYTISWNFNGSLFAATTKDKKLRLCDPRSSTLVAETVAHEGIKTTKVVWLGNSERVATFGFSKSSDREMALWDTRNLTSSLGVVNIENGSGVVTPLYDEDNGMMYIAAKGDGTIYYYELMNEAPYGELVGKHQTSVPQTAAVALPKTDCDVKGVEVLKILKLTQKTLEPIILSIPRTRNEFFQDDLYPPTRANRSVLSADEWFGGANKEPALADLQPAGMIKLSDAPAIVKTVKYSFEKESVREVELDKDQVLGKFFTTVKSNMRDDIDLDKRAAGECCTEEEWD